MYATLCTGETSTISLMLAPTEINIKKNAIFSLLYSAFKAADAELELMLIFTWDYIPGASVEIWHSDSNQLWWHENHHFAGSELWLTLEPFLVFQAYIRCSTDMSWFYCNLHSLKRPINDIFQLWSYEVVNDQHFSTFRLWWDQWLTYFNLQTLRKSAINIHQHSNLEEAHDWHISVFRLWRGPWLSKGLPYTWFNFVYVSKNISVQSPAHA